MPDAFEPGTCCRLDALRVGLRCARCDVCDEAGVLPDPSRNAADQQAQATRTGLTGANAGISAVVFGGMVGVVGRKQARNAPGMCCLTR